METFIDLIEARAVRNGTKAIFQFLPKGAAEDAVPIDYAALSRNAKAIAIHLTQRKARGQRVVIPSHSSPEFLANFFGCMYAGAVAVPTVPGLSERGWERTVAAAIDCEASLILTNNVLEGEQIGKAITRQSAGRSLAVVHTGTLPITVDGWKYPEIDGDSLVFLQYTSGSTTSPRGVRITHRNLMCNQAQIRTAMEHDELSTFVSWLPPFHDMGLVGGLLQPLYLDSLCVFLPSGVFSRDPIVWLEAITRWRAHTSGAPNFAYQLCCETVTEQQLATLDLSSWRVAFNGAEPISPSTLRQFTDRFARVGFRPEAFFPCYGMAETTLMVSGNGKAAPPIFHSVDKTALEANVIKHVEKEAGGAVELVACGEMVPGVTTLIIQPGGSERCPEHCVGEICVHGDNVTAGYWRNALAESAFVEVDGKSYLRTGDMGFIYQRQLYVTGRIKDLIIVRGRNLYPQDIEATVTGTSDVFRSSGAIAFAVPSSAGEQLVVAAEVKRTAIKKLEPNVLFKMVGARLSSEYEVALAVLVLVKPLSLPRTTSGKLQRQKCRQLFLRNELAVLHSVRGQRETHTFDQEDISPLASEIREMVANVMAVGPSHVDLRLTVAELGIDSLQVARLQQAIATRYSIETAAEDFFGGGTLRELADRIAERVAQGETAQDIPRGAAGSHADMLPQQSAVYVYSSLNPQSTAYHVPLEIRLQGRLDPHVVGRTLQGVVERHDLLRATIATTADGPVFQIGGENRVDYQFVDLRQTSEEQQNRELAHRCAAESARLFSLADGPLARFRLFRLRDDSHLLFAVFHHVIADGWALSRVFFEDFVSGLQAELGVTPLPNAVHRIRFGDYSAWIGRNRQAPAVADSRKYWISKLAKPLPWPVFGGENLNRAVGLKSMHRRFELSVTDVRKINTAAKRLETSLYAYLLTCFKVAYARLCRQTDICVGTMLLSRSQKATSGILGFLANPVVVRTDLSGVTNFCELVTRVHAELLAASRYGAIAFADIVAEAKLPRRRGASPVFRAFFVQQEAPPEVELPTLRASGDVRLDLVETRFDLEIHFWRKGDAIVGDLLAKSDAIESESANALLDDFRTIAVQAAEQTDAPITRLGGQSFVPIAVETRLERAILMASDVQECAVLRRGTGKAALYVAYVVLRLRRALHELSQVVPTDIGVAPHEVCVVPVRSLPRTSSGAVAFDHLLDVEVIDEQWISAIVRQAPGANLALRWKTAHRQFQPVAATLAKETVVPAVQTKALPAGSNRLAYAHGGELMIPEDAPKTLVAALIRSAEKFPNRGIRFVQHNGTETTLLFPELLARAQRILAGLQVLGLKPGTNAILQLTHLPDHLATFWACLLGGVRPVAIAVASDYSAGNSVVTKLRSTWEVLEHPPIIANNAIHDRISRLATALKIENLRVVAFEELGHAPTPARIHPSQPGDVAFFQLTSGSTGISKCIQETHSGVIAHIHSSAQFNGYRDTDVSLNWLPFDHVVPILTWHLKNTYLGCEQVELPTSAVLAEPTCWLTAIEKYRVTHSWCPNFGFKLVVRSLQDAPAQQWDLSSLKALMNAGEQVTVPVVREFLEATARFGVRSSVMQPSFGMAEACTCMTYTNDFDLKTSVHTFRSGATGGRLETASSGEPGTISFIDLGPPTPGVEIRITDAKNEILPEAVIGRFQIRGPVITPGYFNNESANQEAFVGDGWFNSGDLGYILNGRLAITGREKEQIVMQGVNYYCYEIEDIVNQVPGVIPTFAAACAVDDADSGTESFAVFFCTELDGMEAQRQLSSDIRRALAVKMGTSPKHVIPVARAQFPKTTSGKIQRTQLKKQLAAGEFNEWIRAKECEPPVTAGAILYQDIWIRVATAPAPFVSSDLKPGILVVDEGSVRDAPISCKSDRPLIVYRDGKVEHITSDSCIGVLNLGTGVSEFRVALGGLFGSHRKWQIVFMPNADATESSTRERYSRFITNPVSTLQRWAKQLGPRPEWISNISVVTGGAYEPCDGRAPQFELGATTALLQSLSAELGVECQHIDICGARPSWSETLQAELDAPTKEPIVVLRHGQRWVRRLEQVNAAAGKASLVKAGIRCVVIGGLGGVGLELCHFLLRQWDAQLLIVGRRPLQEVRDRYEALAKLGSVRYESADAKDVVALGAALDRQEASWGGSVQLIVHLAGEMPLKGFGEMESGEFRSSCAQKIEVALAIGETLATRPDAAVVYFSSINARFGGALAAAYSFANAFLHEFAKEQRAAGRKALCIGWSRWDGLGMSAGAQLREAAARKGYLSLSVDEALRAFMDAVAMDNPSLVAGLNPDCPPVSSLVLASSQALTEATCTNEFGAALPTFVDRCGSPIAPQNAIVSQSKPADAGSELLGHARGERADIREQLVTIWRKYLKTPVIGPDQNFFDLGGGSVLLAQIQGAIAKSVYPAITLVDLFEYPTLNKLTQFITQRIDPPSQPQLAFGSRTEPQTRTGDIAIIGMACRFPGANTIDEFWSQLQRGEDCISNLPDDALIQAGVPKSLLNNPNYVRRGGLLRDALGFDEGFFGYSRTEALMMDPQQRVLLMCAWEAFESAGYDPFDTPCKVGVFAGTGINTYLHHCVVSKDQLLPSLEAFSLMIANDKDFAATKISYRLGLTGPSINVQTACSTSLAAVHLACRSIQAGDCEMALAGAATIRYPHAAGYLFQRDMILSADGHCRPFSRDANGTVNSSGAGVVLLKPLSRALEDRDPIWAVIKGTALNNDGRDKVGYTAPGLKGQADVVEQAIRASDVDPASISYIEAHGTGTPVGDPIELRALTKVFSATRVASPITIGAVKGNIGHTDTASGIAGLIKTACMLRFGVIPATAHFDQSDPKLGPDPQMFTITAATRPWSRANGVLRRAGVSSFGIGGTNTHAILEEAPAQTVSQSTNKISPLVLTLSAKSPRALREVMRRFENQLSDRATPADITDICFTSNVGRSHWQYRRAIAVSSIDALRVTLCHAIAASPDEFERLEVRRVGDRRIVFLFEDVEGVSRLNVQYWMQFPAFRRVLSQCDDAFTRCTDASIVKYVNDLSTKSSATKEWCEIGLEFAFYYSLARVFTEWGVVPTDVKGKGAGRIISAAYREHLRLPDATAQYLRHVASIRGRAKLLPKNLSVLQSSDDLVAEFDENNVHDGSSQELLLRFASVAANHRGSGLPMECASTEELSRMLAMLYDAGASVHWTKVHEGNYRQRVCLPTYPFELRKFDVQEEMRRSTHTAVARKDSVQVLERLRSSGRLSIKAQEAITEIVGALDRDSQPPVESAEVHWEALAMPLESASGDPASWALVTAGARHAPALLDRLRASNANVEWLDVAAGERDEPDLIAVEKWIERNAQSSHTARIVVCSERCAVQAPEESLGLAWQYLGVLKSLVGKLRGRNVTITVAIANDDHADVLESLSACALIGGIKAMLWEHPRYRPAIVEYQAINADLRIVEELLVQASPGHFRVDGTTCLVPRVKHSKDVWCQPAQFSADATYLITGGTGSLGRELAEWLVDRGVRHLILVGRKVTDEVVQSTVARLNAAGARCRTFALDLSNEVSVSQLFERLRAEPNPLRGVFHLAGTLADEPLEHLSSGGVRQTLRNKALSAFYVSKFTAQLHLDHFVLFSSIVATFGSPGQASYAAANLFLERLAESRRASGKTALAIGWGPWAGSTMMKHAKRVEALGLESFSPADALACLSVALTASASQLLVFRYRGAQLRTIAHRHEFLHTALSELVKPGPAAAQVPETRHPTVAEMTAVAPAKRRDLIQEVLRFEIAKLLDSPLEDVEVQRGFSSLGLDSLLVVSLLDRLEAIFLKRISTTAVFNYSNCRALAEHIDEVIWPTATESPAEISEFKAPVLPPHQDYEALIEREFKTSLDA